MSYQPPNDILRVLQEIEFEEALGPDDERYVETREARGSQKTLDRLARKLGLLLSDGRFFPPMQKHVLFFGHTGSGKTTELRRYAQKLGGPDRFFVVEVDISATLDRNNLQYADTLMAMARSLLLRLEEVGVDLGADALAGLESWFGEWVLSSDDVKGFSAEMKATAGMEGGIPYLLKLFAGFTVAFKTNKTYKKSLRQVIRNSFTQFADAFNTLLDLTENTLSEQGMGKRVLFIIDGTDKLRGEDTRRFFVEDAELLLAIQTLVIYTAPLSLKYEGNLTNRLDGDLMLPMMKLYDRDGNRHEPGWATLREILLLRADPALFVAEADIDRLVEHCGGHPRELLRLLKLCCEFCEDDRIDAATVEQAIRQLASEYRRFLEPEDYALLATLDHNAVHAGNDERVRKLLYNLALLEYNRSGPGCLNRI
ncbi:hypothetical protein [Methylomagnum sp.]